MCGIVAVLRQPSDRPAPDLAEMLSALGQVREALAVDLVLPSTLSALQAATETLASVDRSLRGPSGLEGLLGSPGSVDALEVVAGAIGERIVRLEARLDSDSVHLAPERQEEVNASLV